MSMAKADKSSFLDRSTMPVIGLHLTLTRLLCLNYSGKCAVRRVRLKQAIQAVGRVSQTGIELSGERFSDSDHRLRKIIWLVGVVNKLGATDSNLNITNHKSCLNVRNVQIFKK